MISKGKTNIRAEIDFMYEAYSSLISRTENSFHRDINEINDRIRGIKEQNNIEPEELSSLLRPYQEHLDDLRKQESHSMVVLFVGIFSFWERALYGICQYRKIKFLKKDGSVNYAPKIDDFLSQLLNEGQRSSLPAILTGSLDELRNYYVHGSLAPCRKEILNSLSEQSIVSIANDYTFQSFHELQESLELIYKTLIQIESNNQLKS
jgi:hypothetical protein